MTASPALFTNIEAAQIQHAVDLMVLGTAPENIFDATCMESVAKAAASSGFSSSNGEFLQAARDRPISTLLKYLLWLGGAPDGVPVTPT